MEEYIKAVKEMREMRDKLQRKEAKVEELLIDRVKEIAGEEVTKIYGHSDGTLTTVIIKFGKWKEIEIIFNGSYIFEDFDIKHFEQDKMEKIRYELRRITQMSI